MAKVKTKTKKKPVLTDVEAPEASPDDFTKDVAPELPPSIETSPVPNGKTTGNIIDNLLKSPHYRTRPVSTVEGLGTLSTEKRTTKLRDKIGVAADYLADELMFAVSTRSKKDKEYIKGLVWSLGVLFDKLNTGSADTLAVHLPSKLLENVKLAISVQINTKVEDSKVVDVTPTYVACSTESHRSSHDDDKTNYVVDGKVPPST